tara:strand:+ start:435 stop:1490 length:1056 start_codon:yes stop_codon:yes gene_type:complete
MKLNNRWLGTGLFAVLALLFYYMADGFSEKLPTEHKVIQESIAEYETITLVARDVELERQFPGVIVAEQKANISARLTANVADVLVDVGDSVNKGDVLLRLDSGDLDARVTQTEQALSSTQAQLNNARKEYARVKELVTKKLVPQSQFDSATKELQTAQANFNQAQAAVREAETMFGYSIITAPFDGVVTFKSVNEGDTATPGGKLLSLYNPESLQIEVNVSESVMPYLGLGSQTTISFPTYKRTTKGQVVEIAPAADAGSRSYMVKLTFKSQDVLYPGTYAKVMIPLEGEQGLYVPEEAVYQVGQLDYVKVIEDGKLETRLVQLGSEGRVRKGLVAGDSVVLNPRLRPSM